MRIVGHIERQSDCIFRADVEEIMKLENDLLELLERRIIDVLKNVVLGALDVHLKNHIVIVKMPVLADEARQSFKLDAAAVNVSDVVEVVAGPLTI